MIGQLFMVGIKAEALGTEEISAFRDWAVGGFILFKRNLVEAEQSVAFCRSLWNLGNEHPPFIAIDQEGGRVHRLPSPFTHFPAAARIEQTNDTDLAYRLAKATAAELTLVGVNLNFAPVLDVNSNPQNPIIGDRSFGSDPRQVIRFGAATMAGLRDGGVIPCGKHFPGHGHTDQDSHLALPVVDRSPDELRATEFPPFIDACHNGIEAFMTAHVLYPSLDSKFPATLSRTIVTGLLREQWGYNGVVFSDDLEMRAISDAYSCREIAALFAVRAGVDVLLYGHNLTGTVQSLELLCSEAERHAELRARVENSYQRIAALKRRYLKSFTGVKPKDLIQRLARLNHRHVVDTIYGNR